MKTLIAALLIVTGMLVSGTAQAKSDFLDVLVETYKPYEAAISQKSCANCHISDSDFGLNPYGKQIAQELLASGKKELNAEILKKIEALDADGDGTPNLDEFKAGTEPGNPKSGGKPGVTPKVDTSPASAPAPKPKALIPKNFYHPAIVHFPIALFVAGLLLDLIGLLRKQQAFLLAGWYNLVLGALSALGGVSSGFIAMLRMKLPFSGVIYQHLLLAIVSTVIMWLLVVMRVHRHEKMNVPLRAVYYVLAFAALLIISYSGHLGGAFVYGE